MIAVQSVVCRQDSTSKPLVVPLYVIVCELFASRASSRGKHDMGVLSYGKCGNTHKNAHPTSLWQTCFALGRSFARDYGACLTKYSDLVCLHVLYSSAVTVLIFIYASCVLVVQISQDWNYKVHQQLLYIILLLQYSTLGIKKPITHSLLDNCETAQFQYFV